MPYLFLHVFIIMLVITPAFASDTQDFSAIDASIVQSAGLSMHGDPKYSPDFEHLDYVNPNAPKGGHLEQSVIGTFDSLNPYSLKGKAAKGLQLYYERLMKRVWDEPFTMYPLIAERAVVSEDRSSVTFHINKAARFHDGTPITADDVIFSFETLKTHGRPNMRRIYDLVSDVKRIDTHTVHFKFGDGYDQETVMIMAMMPVLSKTWWGDRDFDSATLEPPLSSGPYEIKEFDPGRSITYERNPDYWGRNLPVNVGHYNFDTIKYDYFRDDLVALQSFQAGEIDLRIERDAGKWATQYDKMDLSKIELVEIEHGRPERVNAFIFNTTRPPFNDWQVRKALGLVFDFNWMNKNLFHGQYKRTNSYFPNSVLAASGPPDEAELELLNPYQNDLPPEMFEQSWAAPDADSQRDFRVLLKQADELLKQAGWITVNNQRVRQSDPGTVFSFELVLGNPEVEKVALHYARSLKRLGIEANIRVLDASAFQGRLNNHDYDMIHHFWQNSLSPGTEQALYWGCQRKREPGLLNYTRSCHSAAENFSYKIADAKSYAELTTIARALDRILTWAHFSIPLYHTGRDFVAHKKHIKRPANTPIYGMVLETWWANPDHIAK